MPRAAFYLGVLVDQAIPSEIFRNYTRFPIPHPEFSGNLLDDRGEMK